ncbi:MAG TPA: helix-turn-helix domain-containing protein [Thermoanaerobaculia bacterium]
MTTLDLFAGLEERIRVIVDELVDERVAELNRSPWMNVKEAADYLRCGTSRLYKLTAADAIPHFKEEGRLLFNREDLDEWLEGFRRGPLETPTEAFDPDTETSDPDTVARLLEEIVSKPTPGEGA